MAGRRRAAPPYRRAAEPRAGQRVGPPNSVWREDAAGRRRPLCLLHGLLQAAARIPEWVAQRGRGRRRNRRHCGAGPGSARRGHHRRRCRRDGAACAARRRSAHVPARAWEHRVTERRQWLARSRKNLAWAGRRRRGARRNHWPTIRGSVRATRLAGRQWRTQRKRGTHGRGSFGILNGCRSRGPRGFRGSRGRRAFRNRRRGSSTATAVCRGRFLRAALLRDSRLALRRPFPPRAGGDSAPHRRRANWSASSCL